MRSDQTKPTRPADEPHDQEYPPQTPLQRWLFIGGICAAGIAIVAMIVLHLTGVMGAGMH